MKNLMNSIDKINTVAGLAPRRNAQLEYPLAVGGIGIPDRQLAGVVFGLTDVLGQLLIQRLWTTAILRLR